MAVSGPQELLRVGVRDGFVATSWERSGDVSLKVGPASTVCTVCAYVLS